MRRQPVDIFGDHGLFAVGDTVLAQISLTEVRRHHLDVGAGVDPCRAARGRTAAQALTTAARHSRRARQAAAGHAGVANRCGAAADAWTLEISSGETLPRLFGRRLCRAIEVQQPRLRAGVVLQLQRVVVLPGDPDPARLARDPADAEGLALIPCFVVGFDVPRLRHLAAFAIDRNACGNAAVLRGGDHAPAPVFSHDRHPGTGEIDGIACACGLRRTARAGAALASSGATLRRHIGPADGDRGREHEHTDREREMTLHGYFALLVTAGACPPRSRYTASMNIAVVQGPVSAP